ncbi:hypothetical protein, partial [Heyndrickxia coagulans]|uniref:hypothetical protein n=1 Tax=Heyndrickxia coagulans TaxID=1398 RepID=UPI00214D1ABE
MFNHCEFVKELMDYLGFMFGKGNVSRTLNVHMTFYQTDKEDRSLMDYYMQYTKIYEELNVLLPLVLMPKSWENNASK